MKHSASNALGRIFVEVMELPETKRVEKLEEYRLTAPELVQEIEELIKADAEVKRKGFLSRPSTTCDQTVNRIGQQFGSYKVIEKLGQGGMGTVYRAQRTSDFSQDVAIKFLEVGWSSLFLTERFRIECENLASLEHPNIARILDTGTTDDGIPYFVMEYVNGRPITTYCHAHSLPERIKTLIKLCKAVEFTHRRLIHRDLKPDNILVTESGEPKVLDFGVARIVSGQQATFTIPGQAIGTPAYMSPEQISGSNDVDIRSDVYALGLVCYEVLAERPPYDLSDRPFDEVRQLISGGKIPPPSKFNHKIKKDLEHVLLKSLETNPSDRYHSADHLAEDLERFLNGFPVLAHPLPWPKRAGRWALRNKIASAGLISLLLALCVAVGVVYYNFRQLDEQIMLSLSSTQASSEMLDTIFYELSHRWPDSEFEKASRLNSLRMLQRDFGKQLDVLRRYENKSAETAVLRVNAEHSMARIKDLLGVVHADAQLTREAKSQYEECINLCHEHSSRWPEVSSKLLQCEAEAWSDLGACFGSMAAGVGQDADHFDDHVQSARDAFKNAETHYRKLIKMDVSKEVHLAASHHFVNVGRLMANLENDNLSAFRHFSKAAWHADQFQRKGGNAAISRAQFEKGFLRMLQVLDQIPKTQWVDMLRDHLRLSLETRPGARFQLAFFLARTDRDSKQDDIEYIKTLMDTPDMAVYLSTRRKMQTMAFSGIGPFAFLQSSDWMIRLKKATEEAKSKGS